MKQMWILLLVGWNGLVFLLMGLDKWKAKKGWQRIRERTLLLCAFFCGAGGGLLGMLLFHHKTRHRKFSIGLPAFFILQCILLVWLGAN